MMDGLPDSRMDLAVAARIVANVAAGLHAAHELEDSDGTKMRVVHRDVSPQNILIAKNGHVKVADFGVAKAAGQLHRPTETGEMKGKLAYMAPEQVTAKDIDHRADIFALGCVLYEVTVGRRPFQGEGALSTLYQLLEQAVALPTDVCEGYPAELSSIVLKALAKEPDQRFQTAEDLRIALEGWIAASGSKASEREIAALLRSVCGGEVDEKSRRINEAAAKLKDRASDRPEATGRNSRPTSPAVPASRSREGASTVDRAVATGSIREKSTSWWLPVGAALAVLALVVVLAKGNLGRGQPEAVAPTVNVAAPERNVAASQPVPEPAPAPVEPIVAAEAESIEVTVRTIPANAMIRIDDGPTVASPYVAKVHSSDHVRTIRASAPNYLSTTRQVAFDQTQEIVLELQSQPQRRPKTRAKPEPAAASPAPTVESTPVRPREPVVTPGKRPRALDVDNPFAG
jgi:serine/threonine-protein kinase